MLRTPVVGIHDDYFRLGGTSLRAAEILSQLRQAFGHRLSLRMFFEAPTVAEQAAIIEDVLRRPEGATSAAVAPSSLDATAVLLAKVRDDCRRPPLFCMFGPGAYRLLAEHLSPEQPVYGVFVEGEIDIATGAPPLQMVASVEALARLYLKAVRRIQPIGPYQLAGFSFGGMVALEMAQQLRASGERAALVVLLDTYMTGAVRRHPLRWARHHVRELRRRGLAHVAHALQLRLDSGARLGQGVHGRNAAFRELTRARYRPRPYPGKVLLFRSREITPHLRVRPVHGWGRLLRGPLEIHDVPGVHEDVIGKRGIGIVIDKLRPHLLTAEGRSPA